MWGGGETYSLANSLVVDGIDIILQIPHQGGVPSTSFSALNVQDIVGTYTASVCAKCCEITRTSSILVTVGVIYKYTNIAVYVCTKVQY